jgi:hypothetical protein
MLHHQQTIDDDEAWEIVNGKRVLRDQHRIRVRLADAQRSRERAALTDGRGAPHMIGHRPGYLISRDARQQDAKAQAYAAYERDLANRWRDQDEDDDPPDGAPDGAYPYTASAEGTACTINGFPGTLQRRGDWLVCVANKQSFNGANGPDEDPDTASDSVKDAKRRLAELYRQRDAEDANAWRRS